jgi:hypothetical protein
MSASKSSAVTSNRVSVASLSAIALGIGRLDLAHPSGQLWDAAAGSQNHPSGARKLTVFQPKPKPAALCPRNGFDAGYFGLHDAIFQLPPANHIKAKVLK